MGVCIGGGEGGPKGGPKGERPNFDWDDIVSTKFRDFHLVFSFKTGRITLRPIAWTFHQSYVASSYNGCDAVVVLWASGTSKKRNSNRRKDHLLV